MAERSLSEAILDEGGAAEMGLIFAGSPLRQRKMGGSGRWW